MKAAALAIVASLALGVISPVTAATPIAGSACSSLNSTKTSQGKKYTCIKSGKKYVWSKGRTVKPKNKDVKPIPEPSFLERWNATGSVALKPLQAMFPIKPAVHPPINLIWRYSEKVDSKIKNEITAQYLQNIEFWRTYTKFDSQLQVIIGNLDDISFICQWRDLHLSMTDPNCTTNFRTDKSRRWDAHTTQNNSKGTDFYFMTDPLVINDLDFIPRVPHEFFHNVQHAQTTRYKSVLPCWAEEAGAEYFGIAIASNGDPEKFLKLRFSNVAARVGSIQNSTSSTEFWKKWLFATDMNSIQPGTNQWGCASVQMEGIYHYGLLATEYLVQKFGIAGLLTIYQDSGNIGWDLAIERAFGKSKGDAYEEIANYMNQEYRITIAQTWARPKCQQKCTNGL
ncbi:MAG: hypothetical protein ACO3GT_07870 [Candidatus Nanopelagicales bacterium]